MAESLGTVPPAGAALEELLPDVRHGSRGAGRRALTSIATPAGTVVGALLLWWVLSASGAFAPSVLASPSAVWTAAGISGGQVVGELGTTVIEVLLAIAISWFGGLAFGMLLGGIGRLKPLLGLMRTAYAVPLIAIYPILTVWFGYALESKVIFGAFAGIIPMTLMSASAVMTVDSSIYRLFRGLGASWFTTIWKGVLPATLPGIAGSLRLSGSLALVGVIASELLGSTQGLGYWISNSAQTFDTPDLYLGAVFVVALAIVLQMVIRFIEIACARFDPA